MEDDFKQVQEERRKKDKLEPEDIRSTNQLQILASSHDRQVGEFYPREEEEILGAEPPVIHVKPEDIWQRIVQGLG
jgi:hypothetical protein